MPLGTNNIIKADVPNFIPELWSDEVIAAYKSNLVMANLVRVLNFQGKKGDTIRIPTPTRGDASVKAAETQVTLIPHGPDAGLIVNIDRHVEYSRFIEDIVSVQALESLRRFYTDDGGYAIAKDTDSQLLVEALRAAGATIVYDAATNTVTHATSTYGTIYEGDGTVWDETVTTDLSDEGIRTFIKLLDDTDAPMADRYMVLPTISKKDLLGTARFTEQAFVGEVGASNSIRNGLVGDVYGVEVYVTTRTPIVEDDTDVGDNVLGVMFQRDGILLAEQLSARAQSQYKQEWLADLLTVDTIYGTKQLRESSIVPFVVPTT